MSDTPAGFQLVHCDDTDAELTLSGAWVQGCDAQDFNTLSSQLHLGTQSKLTVDGAALEGWDSTLLAFLLQCYNHCHEQGIAFTSRDLPEGAGRLLKLATAVEALEQEPEPEKDWLAAMNPATLLKNAINSD